MTDTRMNPSRIIGLQFSLLSPEEIRKGSVANIVSRDTYVNNKPVIGGLFDPRMGVLDPGLICPTDGLNYMKTPGYFGHIELARPVFYIQYLNTILKILRCVCIKCSKLLISKSKHKHILKTKNARDRWLYAFPIASKVMRCGDDTCDGCGCKQPKKIQKEGLATIIAEWANIDGIAVCENIRLHDSQVPIMFLSAKSSAEDRVLGLRKGGDDYMTKPFNLEEFMLRVKNLIERNDNTANKL